MICWLLALEARGSLGQLLKQLFCVLDSAHETVGSRARWTTGDSRVDGLVRGTQARVVGRGAGVDLDEHSLAIALLGLRERRVRTRPCSVPRHVSTMYVAAHSVLWAETAPARAARAKRNFMMNLGSGDFERSVVCLAEAGRRGRQGTSNQQLKQQLGKASNE